MIKVKLGFLTCQSLIFDPIKWEHSHIVSINENNQSINGPSNCWCTLLKLTHIAKPPLRERHNAAANPEKLVHHAGHGAWLRLVLQLNQLLLLLLVSPSGKSPLGWGCRLVSGGGRRGGTNQGCRHRADGEIAVHLGRTHWNNRASVVVKSRRCFPSKCCLRRELTDAPKTFSLRPLRKYYYEKTTKQKYSNLIVCFPKKFTKESKGSLQIKWKEMNPPGVQMASKGCLQSGGVNSPINLLPVPSFQNVSISWTKNTLLRVSITSNLQLCGSVASVFLSVHIHQ